MKTGYLAFGLCGIVAGSFVPSLAQDSPDNAPAVIKKKVPDFEAVSLAFQPQLDRHEAFAAKANELLKKRAAEGWEFVAVTSGPMSSNGDFHTTVYQYIFKRE